MLTLDELEDRLHRWSDLERAALEAEEKLWSGSQADDMAALAHEAADKRRVADDALSELLGEVKGHAAASNDAHASASKRSGTEA